jgi:hypothetical protein
MDMTTKLRDVPPILLVDLSHDKLVFSEELVIPCEDIIETLWLRGIIYGGQGHFTCRFIDKAGDIWVHDRMVTGRNCLPEINIQRVADWLSLHECGEKKAVAVIYARVLR